MHLGQFLLLHVILGRWIPFIDYKTKNHATGPYFKLNYTICWQIYKVGCKVSLKLSAIAHFNQSDAFELMKSYFGKFWNFNKIAKEDKRKLLFLSIFQNFNWLETKCNYILSWK